MLAYVAALAIVVARADAAGEVAAADAEVQKLYEARMGKCDYFVATHGDDKNDGTDIESPFESLTCACSSKCNEELQTEETICVLEGEYEVFETIYIEGANMRDKELKIMNLGRSGKVVLDGMDQVAIFNTLQTHTTFQDITFRNANGASGGAVYGERRLHFNNCLFDDNEASIHGGAVMGGRGLTFDKCVFRNNKAMFAGAVRINDIGSAILTDCLFIGNSASGRGGALVTQIEDPHNEVKVENTLFCFNESPMSPHIYNYRSSTHQCTKCRFNSRECCSNHGRVVKKEDADVYFVPEGANRTRVCACEDGFSGERCENAAAIGDAHIEL